jgi:prevent-host-death family protein
MLNAEVRPIRDLRNNYADIKKSLAQNDHVIITNNGVGEAVLINFEMYKKFEEFLHHQYIYNELQKSKAKANSPDAIRHEAEDVFAEFEKLLKSSNV